MHHDSFHQLVEKAVRMPGLSDDDQKALLDSIAKAKADGNIRAERLARNKLIMWAASIAIKVALEETRRFDDNVEEAISASLYMLCTANIIEGFKYHSRGIRLSKYIEMGIRSNLKRESRKLRGRVKISTKQWESLEKLWAIRAQFPEASNDALQDHMALTVAEFTELLELESMMGNIADLDYVLEDGLSLHGIIADPNSLPDHQEENENWAHAHQFVLDLADHLGVNDGNEIEEILSGYLEGSFNEVAKKYALGEWAESAIAERLQNLKQAIA